MAPDERRRHVILYGMRKTVVLSFLLAPFLAGALAAACPDPENIDAEMQALFARANKAENFRQGQEISDAMWRAWLRAPDEPAQAALDAGLARRGAYDFAGALKEFDRLAKYCPTYAEGFNQRAYIHFLREDYDKALGDLEIALSLQPLHVAAQSGRALTLMNLGRLSEAREQLLIAVGNNPWLSEKALLAEGAPLGPSGKDI